MPDEFELSGDIVHLNHAAVGPWPQCTVKAVERFAAENGSLGSRHYDRWLMVEQALREQLRSLVNAASCDEIALLKSTSEALSVIAWGIDWREGDEVVIPRSEFPSNRIVWESLATRGVRVIRVDIEVADPEAALITAFTPRTRLLSVSSVQYATGQVLWLDRLGEICRQRHILFCVDAIQSLGALPFDAQSCQADFVVADGHKWMLGPEGVALFYCRREHIARLRLRQFGWHMVEAMGDFDRDDWEPAATARRFECGSPNMLGIHALNASLELILARGVPEIARSIADKTQHIISYIDDHGGVLISARAPARRGGIVTFRRPGEDPAVRFRHLQASGVICAMRGGGIRFSPHFHTSTDTLDRALQHAFEPV